MKFLKIVTFLFTLITLGFIGYLLYRNGNIHDQTELIAFLFWFTITVFAVYFVAEIAITSNVCF